MGPDNYLAWVPGGFDDPSFRRKMERLPGLDEAVVVAGDTLWLRKTVDADGTVVDDRRARSRSRSTRSLCRRVITPRSWKRTSGTASFGR